MSRKKALLKLRRRDTQMDQNWADLDEPLGKDCEDTNKYYGTLSWMKIEVNSGEISVSEVYPRRHPFKLTIQCGLLLVG